MSVASARLGPEHHRFVERTGWKTRPYANPSAELRFRGTVRAMDWFGKTPPPWVWRWTVGALVLFWLSQAAVSAISALSDIFVILLVSFFVACALEQPVDRLERRGMRRGAATLLVLLGAIASTAAVIAAGGAVAMSQVNSLRSSLPDMISGIVPLLDRIGIHTDSGALALRISDAVQEALNNNAGDLILRSGLVVGQIAAGALAVFYLVADGPRLRRIVCSVLPQQRQQQVLDVWTATIDKAGGYFIVRGVLAAVATVTSWAFFSLIGMPYSVALAIWVGVISQVIPAVGTYLAGALPLLIAAGMSSEAGIAVLVFLVLYQQIENYLISPRLSRKVLSVHPAIAFFSALCGGILAGAAGALIAVPLVATVEAVIAASVERHQLIDNELLNAAERAPKTPKTPRAPREPRTPRVPRKGGGKTSK
jgi:predicted PurR-regulated permease PerM